MLRKILVSLSVLISSCSTLPVPKADTTGMVYYLDLGKEILYNHKQSIPFEAVPDKMYCAEVEIWDNMVRRLGSKRL